MAWIGQGLCTLLAGGRSPSALDDESRSTAAAHVWLAASVVAAVGPALWLWGFTVDDALISIRYARHVADGVGYRFNAGGASTDGVTPLAWPFVLAPLAHGDALRVLGRAKLLGLALHAIMAVVWGRAVGRVRTRPWVKGIAVVTLAACVPCAAHAVSGMETALAMCLCTWASVLPSRPRLAALLAGLAASLRPELLPWAAALALGFETRSAGRALAGLVVAASPFAICCAVRLVAFGHVAPLAVSAKPSDLAHGLAYVGAASFAALAPLLAFAPVAVARSPRPVKTLAVAALVHLAAVAACGGDWMPYARLVAPIVPSCLLVFVGAAAFGSSVVAWARAIPTLGLGAYLLVTAAPAARRVGTDRERLVMAARPYLQDARRVAALDVGWPTAATEATIVDLGGLTDPEVAAMRGGQTSKRIDDMWLLGRRPDVLLAYATQRDGPLAAWRDARFVRGLEARLASSELLARHFEARAFLPLGDLGAGYFVLVPSDPDR